jgi:Methylamine utilisation protein MauE
MIYAAFGCECLLIVVFAVSAAAKLTGKGAFTEFRLATARLVPAFSGLARPLAVAVVGVEIATAALLAVPATTRAGLVLALVLLGAFTVAIAAALRRGETASCNCFGRSTTPMGARHLVRNALLLTAAGTGLAAGAGGWTGAEVPGMALAGASAVVLAVLVLNLDALTDLFATTPVPERTTS